MIIHYSAEFVKLQIDGDRNAAAVPCPGPLLYGIFLFISRIISATSISPSTSSYLTGLPALFGPLSQ